ncbi:MAG: FtsX-like permease family protein [Rhodospirillaceae bacterium]|nr:FtsX-like permease family protein [Rhodospirillaceae bacterium]
MAEWRLALKLLRRELRGGLKGFYVFLASLFLGVAAIAGVGSIGASVTAGLKADGQKLLGGDVDLRLLHRDATPEQRQWLTDNTAQVSEIVKMRAMARPSNRPLASKSIRSLVELKAVDDQYPLAGQFVAKPNRPLPDLLSKQGESWGAVVDANLLTRLGIAIGDTIKVGDAHYQIRATVAQEPDRIVSLFSLGPRLLVARSSLAATKLIQPGSQIRYHTRALLPPSAAYTAWTDNLAEAFPKAGWRVRGADEAAPGVRRFMERMNLFLSFVGLTVLLVGGIGVAGTVSSFLATKNATIAMLKCIGAPGRLVFRLYMGQVLVLAALGVVLGCGVGGALPLAFAALAGDALPAKPIAAIYWQPLTLAAIFGLATAATFAIWPVARAREVPAAALFRDTVSPILARPRRTYILAAIGGVMLLAALTLWSSTDRYFAAWFVGGALATFGLLTLGARLVMHRARNYTGPAGAATRMALGNLYRPGAATLGVVLSLGLGLSVLAAITLIEGNLSAQIDQRLPERAPAFFFMDIQPHQVAAFDAAVTGIEGTGGYQRVPTLRGRIVKIDGVPVEKAEIAPGSRWAIRGDRALTYAATQRNDTKITKGEWWPSNYSGPPIISLDAGLAKGFAISVGDTLSVNILGREVTAKVASLREIDWRSLRFDFAIIFAPGTLDAAPQTHIAAIEAPSSQEDAVEAAATDAFPNISAIRVRDALEAAADMLAGIGGAIRGTAALTVLAGAIVLAGTLAAGRRRRIYESVVFKVLGATRRRLALVFMVEYGLLGLVTGTLAAGVGTLTAWAVVKFLMRMEWTFMPGTLAATLGVCVFVTLAVGFLGTWRALGASAAPFLRND